VKQLFGTRSQTRRSSRKKKNKTNLADSSTAKTNDPPAESSPSQPDNLQTTKTQEEDPPADPTSTKAVDSPAHSSLTQADEPPADSSPSPIDLAKTKEDDPPSNQAKTKVDDAKADSPKKKANDHLPPSSNERKKPPNLEAKIPRKNRKGKESLPETKGSVTILYQELIHLHLWFQWQGCQERRQKMWWTQEDRKRNHPCHLRLANELLHV
jgi:hypothetical protein